MAEKKESPQQKVYKKPEFKRLGTMSQVTQKSGPTDDLNRTMKPGGGRG